MRSFAKEKKERKSYESQMNEVVSIARKESIARALFFGMVIFVVNTLCTKKKHKFYACLEQVLWSLKNTFPQFLLISGNVWF